MAKKDAAMCWASKVAWVVTALVSINMGMSLFEFNFFQSNFYMMNLQALTPALMAIIGLCGLFSFATFVMHCSGNCKSCKM